MRLIRDIDEFTEARPPGAAGSWTAIIPAAGRGSRLNCTGPKILYPVLGKPMLEWLITLLEPLCGDLVFVLSPEAPELVGPLLQARLGSRARTVIQPQPTGMADAIAVCEGFVKTPYTLVLWGDQITPRGRSLAACMTFLESTSSLHAAIPTMIRDAPYIHFKRDDRERIVDVFQARESAQKMAQGESDCGAFCFRTEALFQVLRQARGSPLHKGARTNENNFLSLIPLFHDDQGALATVRLHDAEETLGINTAEDAQEAGRILKRRQNE
ncbi:MAG: hypothetical protein A2992_01890 [Elusimicrobia bacterium RIFCSPLOWO2_01_FULL_59_12]|nr:MAG: hypothetical protein A2992_01890 [Elusimicrobia bacterium RIFCSPLOWO2_01_FULL_59_12]